MRLLCNFLGRITLALMLIGVLLPAGASAQALLGEAGGESATAAMPNPLTPDAARDMVSRLSDQEVRSLLLERLDAVAKENEAENNQPAWVVLGETVGETSNGIRQAVTRVPEMVVGVGAGFATFFEPRGWSGIGRLIGLTVIGILIGFAVERFLDYFLQRWRGSPVKVLPDTLRETFQTLTLRAFFEAFGLIVFFYVTGFALRALLSGDAPTPIGGSKTFPDALIATSFVGSVIIFPRIMRLINRFLMAPAQPHLRLIHTDDWSAKYLFRQSTIVFIILGILSFTIPFLASHGVKVGEYRIGFWLNTLAYGIFLYTIWRAREGLTMMLMGRDEDVTRGEAAVAWAYPYICMALIVLNWLLIETLVAKKMFHLLDGRATITLILLVFAPTFDTAVRGMVRRLVPPMSGEGIVAQAAYIRTKRSYIRIGRVVATVGLILIVTWLWEIDLTNLAAAGTGFRIVGIILEAILILLIGYMLWELVSLWINRKLAAERTAMGFDSNDEGLGDEGGTGVSRLATVLPLLLGVIKVAIAVIFGLIALGNLGVDTTPLLAGAGIVGLAIGFGAQKLVTDIVSGIFFLIDDAFRAGEYLDVEGTMGTVEQISIRSMQLRHHKGAVHTIPYGEIPKVTNYSRDWVIVKLKFTVPFDTNPQQVKKLFKKIGAEMMEVPEFADDFLQPFKSQGVFDFDDVGMIIRGKFKAKPGKQFVLRKEIYNRVKAAFEANDISFARREVRVAIPGLEDRDDLNEEQKAGVSAAAAQAVDTATAPQGA